MRLLSCLPALPTDGARPVLWPRTPAAAGNWFPPGDSALPQEPGRQPARDEPALLPGAVRRLQGQLR